MFIQNPAVVIFVLKLSEELSHHPTIEYYGTDGRPVINPYRSYLSHKEILQHCLRAVFSQRADPYIITVGTHRDIEDGCTETHMEKNQQLKTLLDPYNLHVVYKGENLNEVIFAVNGKAPQHEDRRVAKVLRQEIVSNAPQSIKMPIAWFGLEVLLQTLSDDGILSLTNCEVYAKKLFIEGNTFTAALHHLINHNVFLYYPEVLPRTLFCDPQVVLTKVTELVQYHHKLRDNPDMTIAARGDLAIFRDRGVLSVQLLRKFPKHYKEGLFTPQDLLKLLCYLRAIAMIKVGEYLMPALLPHLESVDVSKHCQQGTSLIIRPTQGCIPSGLFCCLVAHLLSPTNSFHWKVCMKRNKPLCLYRNCISFVQSGATEVVTLIDMFSYIAVHVDEASSEACRKIRGLVHSGIKSACSVLKYHDVQFEDAFMCAGAHCTSDPPHAAVVVPSGSLYKWRCTIVETQRGGLGESQLMWLEPSEYNYNIDMIFTMIQLYTFDSSRNI